MTRSHSQLLPDRCPYGTVAAHSSFRVGLTGASCSTRPGVAGRTQIRRVGETGGLVNNRSTEWLTRWGLVAVTPRRSSADERIPSRVAEDDTRRSVSSRTNAMLASTNRSHVSSPATLVVLGTTWWWPASLAAVCVLGLWHQVVQKNAELGLAASTNTIERTATRNTAFPCPSSGKDEANEALE